MRGVKFTRLGTSLAVQWLGLWLPLQGAQVRSLAAEVRSHMWHSMAKKKKARLDDREDMRNEVIKNNSFLTHISRWMVVLFFKLGNKDQRLVCRKFEFSLGHAEFKLLQVEISSVTEHTGLESE